MKIKLLQLSILLAIILLSTGAKAQTKLSKTELLNKIDSIFADYNKPDVPGASVLIIENGEIVVKRTYGLARLEPKIETTENTCYRLASISKQFTAMAIMMLKEQGKLSLDNTITDLYPDFPAYGRNITIDHLVHHVSGVINYEELLPEADRETVGLESRPDSLQLTDRDVFELLAKIDSTYFEPGTDYRYSNAGYAILTMIIEKASGMDFASFLEKSIFKPLGMNNAIAYERGKSTLPNRAYGYTKIQQQYKEADQSYTSAILGDGGIYCSISDYCKWEQALYTDRLVSFEALDHIFKPYQLKDGRFVPTGYGFGWYIYESNNVKYTLHRGTTYGFSNIVIHIPELKQTFMILTNRNATILYVYDMVLEIANLCTGNLFQPSIEEPLLRMIREQDTDSAIKQYFTLKKESSKYFYFGEACLNNLGSVLLSENRYEDAIKIFILNISQFPKSSITYENLGLAQFLSGERKSALETYKKALALDKNSIEAKRMIEYLKQLK